MTEQAGQIAHSLIQGYLGPDHRIMDMQSFYRYTRPTHTRGWERAEAEGLVKH
jgi:hypothetical protein